MARSQREKKTGRKESSRFIGFPELVMELMLAQLSNAESKLLMGIAAQYRGKNNGDLTATAKQAKVWGIRSQTTLANGLRALEHKGFILKTRQGVFLNPNGKPSLYAIGWQAIDSCGGKLEIGPTSAPPNLYTAQGVIVNKRLSPINEA